VSQVTYATPSEAPLTQSDLITSRSVVTEAYTVIPRGVMQEGVSSYFPQWQNSRGWVLAKPVVGFSTTFAQYLMQVEPSGGSSQPEPEEQVESFLFVLAGTMDLVLDGQAHVLEPGGYAYIPPRAHWTVANTGDVRLKFQWIRKRYDDAGGFYSEMPPAIVGREQDVKPADGAKPEAWASRLIPIDDLRYDMNVNIVNFQPGAVIPYAETHVMEHGLYVLQGKGVYRLNQDWVEVEAGDFLWLRPFCPQACYAGGPDNFRYLLYKDVHRQVRLSESR
jgi:(S)-ureidoglycine aminohydrolase